MTSKQIIYLVIGLIIALGSLAVLGKEAWEMTFSPTPVGKVQSRKRLNRLCKLNGFALATDIALAFITYLLLTSIN